MTAPSGAVLGAAVLRDRVRHEPAAGGELPRALLPPLRAAAGQDGARHRLRHRPASHPPGRARLRHVGARSLAREHRLPQGADRGQGLRRQPDRGGHDPLQAAALGGRGDLHAGLAGPPADQRGAARPSPLRRPRAQEGRALRLRPLHVLLLDRSGAALVLDAAARQRHRARHLRGAQGPEPGDADLLRGHGARGARERHAAGLPPAPRLPNGLSPGAAEPGPARRRVRDGRMVLRLQAPPPSRRGPPSAADGRRAAKAARQKASAAWPL